MVRLRHLHVTDHVEFDLHGYELRDSSQLGNLVTFSSPSLSHQKHAEEILKRLPNLRKLRCIFTESWDPIRNHNVFPALDLLTELEALNIFYYGNARNPGTFNLPLNLNKLTLSNFRLPWSHISVIGKLQKLEVLKLLPRAFEGRRWDMKEGEFLKLKFLKLENLKVAQWNASSDHLPNLEQLELRNCKDLEEVPYTFGEISTLMMIQVQFCGQSTEESVRNMAEEGIEGLKIIINNKIL